MDSLVALSYLVKNVWGVGGKGRGNLELSHIKRDHPYCRAPTRNFECGGRLLVQKCEGFKPMDVEQGNVSKPLLKPRQTRDISLCIESVETPKKKYISWKTDPFSMWRDAFQTSWSQGLNYAFPPFILIARVLAKVQREKASLILLNPAWKTIK